MAFPYQFPLKTAEFSYLLFLGDLSSVLSPLLQGPWLAWEGGPGAVLRPAPGVSFPEWP